jgi:cytochrome c oxidase assembly protein subunit 15
MIQTARQGDKGTRGQGDAPSPCPLVPPSPCPEYNPLLHRTAQLTAAATLLLIFMGGLVTSHGAGMSVPDWPNSYGYNMFTFPPSKWIGGIFYEHTHRLMGTVVGMLSIALTIIAWKTEPRRWVRWLCASVLGAVIFQGVLGGLRVVLVKLDLAIVHACVAQAFFCLCALTAVVTSKWWMTAPDLSATSNGRTLIRLAAACAIAIYLQLVIGAMMRHFGAGLAIPDFPLSYGRLLPPTSMTSDQVYETLLTTSASSDVIRTGGPVTVGKIWLHFSHRVGALFVAILILWLSFSLLFRCNSQVPRRSAVLLVVLLITQVTLGILTVLWRKPADVASLHVATGALTLMTTFVLLIRSMRLYSPLWRAPSRRGFEVTNLKSNPSLVPA